MSKQWLPLQFDDRCMTKWNWMCQHHDKLILGNKVDIGAFTYINALHTVSMGDNVQIGSHCSIYTVSTIDNKQGAVSIGEGSRIGTHSTIMPGVTIGKNVLVGAYSFVNRDLPDDFVGFGVPVKEKRMATNRS